MVVVDQNLGMIVADDAMGRQVVPQAEGEVDLRRPVRRVDGDTGPLLQQGLGKFAPGS